MENLENLKPVDPMDVCQILYPGYGYGSHHTHLNGYFYWIDLLPTMRYMMQQLNGFHDFTLLDCEYKSSIRARTRCIEVISHEYGQVNEDTLLLRYYGASVYSSPVVELLFTNVAEWNFQGACGIPGEVFGAEVKLVKHSRYGEVIQFSMDNGSSVLAGKLKWRTLSPEFYFNGAVPLERYTDSERSTVKRWVDTFGADKDVINERVKDDCDQFIWQLIDPNEWAQGDEARTAFDAVSYDRALCFKTAYYSLNEEHIRLQELSRIGKVKHTEFEELGHIEDIYIVAEDFSWTYIHTHETMFGPYFRRVK